MVGLRRRQAAGHCMSYRALVASYNGILLEALISKQAETCTKPNVADLFLCFRAQRGKDNLLASQYVAMN